MTLTNLLRLGKLTRANFAVYLLTLVVAVVLIALAISAGFLLSAQNVMGKINVNSTTMMATDTDTGMVLNPFSGMALPKDTGTITMNNDESGMMLMLNNKTGMMVMMNPQNDTINRMGGMMMKIDNKTGITEIIDKKTGMILDPKIGKMVLPQEGIQAMMKESGMMMGMPMNSMK
jgi:hypothetical protein